MSVKLPPKALVTGGAGFLGTHLCRRLLDEGYEVTCLDNLFTGMKSHLTEFAGNARFNFIQADVTVPFRGQYDEIYNLACPASPPHYQRNPLETLWTSILGMKHCLELARDTGAKVLHASTSEIYGDPLVHPQIESYWGNVNTIGVRSCYDEGKRVAETMASEFRRCHGVDVRMVRIFNTYGPYMHPQDGRVVSNFILQALAGEPITIYGDGSQTRSFQYCDDLIEAMRRFMAKPRAEVEAFFAVKGHPAAPVLNTGNPGEFTIKELAEKVTAMVGSRSEIVYRPLPGDDPKKRKPDIALAKEFLGWEPKVPLQAGLAKTIEYFRKFVGGAALLALLALAPFASLAQAGEGAKVGASAVAGAVPAALVPEHIALEVADPEAMEKWWCEHLGFKVTLKRTGGSRFLADATGKLAFEVYGPAAGQPPVNHWQTSDMKLHFGFASKDVEADKTRLVAAGATCGAKDDVPGLKGYLMRDPQGIPFQIVQRARSILTR